MSAIYCLIALVSANKVEIEERYRETPEGLVAIFTYLGKDFRGNEKLFLESQRISALKNAHAARWRELMQDEMDGRSIPAGKKRQEYAAGQVEKLILHKLSRQEIDRSWKIFVSECAKACR